MKPAPFTYLRPDTVADAVAALADHGDDARILAGGQSLLPMLNMRLAAPEVVIDIGRLDDLRAITETAGAVRIGALARHTDVLASPVVAEHLPLIADAMSHVAHTAVRNRGTFGGSLAHADPAAEMPACALALGATLEAQGPTGTRDIAAGDFFRGVFATALAADELLTAVRFPAPPPGAWRGFAEVVRRHGDYAMAGLAAHGARAPDGTFADLRLVCFGVADRPVMALAAAAALTQGPVSSQTIAAAQAALDAELSPDGDLYATPTMKRHLARTLLGRVFANLVN